MIPIDTTEPCFSRVSSTRPIKNHHERVKTHNIQKFPLANSAKRSHDPGAYGGVTPGVGGCHDTPDYPDSYREVHFATKLEKTAMKNDTNRYQLIQNPQHSEIPPCQGGVGGCHDNPDYPDSYREVHFATKLEKTTMKKRNKSQQNATFHNYSEE